MSQDLLDLLPNHTQTEENPVQEQIASDQDSPTPDSDLNDAKTNHQTLTKESAAVQEYGLSKAEDGIRFLKAAWTDFLSQILARLGDTPENRAFLETSSELLQTSNLQTAYNGIQFMELYNYHINGQRPIDLGTLFVMNDFMRGMSNHISAIPQNYMNVHDYTSPGASSDPRLGFDPLPISKLTVDPANARVPVKIETFTDIMYGYLQMMSYQTMIGDKAVTLLTNHPCIRIKDNLVSVNAIYRWCEVDNDIVKQAWYQGRSIVKKVPPKTNPIEDNPATGSTTDDHSQ